jgi:hypothetical protein
LRLVLIVSILNVLLYTGKLLPTGRKAAEPTWEEEDLPPSLNLLLCIETFYFFSSKVKLMLSLRTVNNIIQLNEKWTANQ